MPPVCCVIHAARPLFARQVSHVLSSATLCFCVRPTLTDAGIVKSARHLSTEQQILRDV